MSTMGRSSRASRTTSGGSTTAASATSGSGTLPGRSGTASPSPSGRMGRRFRFDEAGRGMSYELIAILLVQIPTYIGLGYLIWIDYRARNTFTPGEAAIFREMR